MISDDISAATAAAPWSEAAGLSSEHQASSVDIIAAAAECVDAVWLRMWNVAARLAFLSLQRSSAA